MTATTTAVVLTSPKGFGPFGAPGWRINGMIQVVEGGSTGPFLLSSYSYSNAPYALGPLHANGEDAESVSRALVLAGLALNALPEFQETLVTARVLAVDGTTVSFLEDWKLGGALLERCVSELRHTTRFGIVVLDEMNVVGESVSERLRAWGLTLDVFLVK